MQGIANSKSERPSDSPGARLRQLVGQRATIAAGCYDSLSAKLAQQAGFHALHVTGFGVEASLLATPDMGLVTLTELASVIQRMTSATDLPIICDVDTGFGEIENVARTVALMERAGAAAIHIEDAGSPKRNPFAPGRTVIDREQAVTRVTVAVESRADKDFVIVGRSDADCVSVDELVTRSNLFLKAGADLAMPVTARINDRMMGEMAPDEQMEWHRKIVSSIDGPVLGMTAPPGYAPKDMLALGYAIMIMPMVSFLPAVRAMWDALRAASPDSKDAPGPINSPVDLMAMMGIDQFIARQERHLARERGGK
jgi:2-methylisocitrate lyase-like PEP mutase family enzyme